jgi:hypothetical protein
MTKTNRTGRGSRAWRDLNAVARAIYCDDIGADHIEAFLDKLCDVCGVQSFP